MVATNRTYTDDDRELVLALIQSGKSQRDVAAATGIPLSTVNFWNVRTLASLDALDTKATDYTEIWAHASRLAAQIAIDQFSRALEADERLPAKDVRDLLVAGGISTDKFLDLRDGRKGTNINVDARSITMPAGLSLEELKALAQLPPPASAP